MDSQLSSGVIIAGRYRIERELARGGMGTVHLGTQLPLNRPVAIKMIAPSVVKASQVPRFLLEAAVLGKLKHPNIVEVYDSGTTPEGAPYLVMEYLEGETLAQVLASRRLVVPSICNIALQICRALREAHRQHIVHRDLKPSNVMFMKNHLGGDADDDDFVKVVDFGLVKALASAEVEAPVPNHSLFGPLLGSPSYMAPEQIVRMEVDARTDIYGFGALLFHMIARRPPFVGGNEIEILEQHLNKPVPRAELPSETGALELDVIARRCLAKRPDDRYVDVESLILDLKAVQRLTGITGAFEDSVPHLFPSTSPPEHRLTASSRPDDRFVPHDLGSAPIIPTMPAPSAADERRTRSPWIMLAAAIALLLIGGGAVWFMTRPSQEPRIVELMVRFSSEPSGATVREGTVLLGVTPFIKVFDVSRLNETANFEFALDGYRSVVVQRRLDASDVALAATLSEAPASEPAPMADNPNDEPDSGVRARRNGVSRTRRRPRNKSRSQPTDVPKIGGGSNVVPKLGGNTASEVVPRLGAEDVRDAVPRLNDDGRVPKLGDEIEVPKLR